MLNIQFVTHSVRQSWVQPCLNFGSQLKKVAFHRKSFKKYRMYVLLWRIFIFYCSRCNVVFPYERIVVALYCRPIIRFQYAYLFFTDLIVYIVICLYLSLFVNYFAPMDSLSFIVQLYSSYFSFKMCTNLLTQALKAGGRGRFGKIRQRKSESLCYPPLHSCILTHH